MKTINIDDQWKFHQGFIDDAAKVALNDDSWQTISIPHTWNAKDVQNGGGRKLSRNRNTGYYRGVGWYRKQILFNEDWNDKRIFIRFGAAGSVATVFLNGKEVGDHYGAFSAICFEITDLVEFGVENLIAVQVSNKWRNDLPPLSGDFPVMGGLYRTAELLIKSKICISPLNYASSGVYLDQTSVSKEEAKISARVLVSNPYFKDVEIEILYSIFEMEKIAIQSISKTVIIPANSTEEITNTIEFEQPHLWNGREDPHLYRFSAEIYHDSQWLDSVSEPLGLRYYHVDPESGFFLNGKSYRVNGVCRHQDRQDKGWAISEEDQAEDFQLIHDMGARGVRLAHYQHSDYFYSLCDKGGILVWAELALVNEMKTNSDFYTHAKNMLKELIYQNYNHPSIFCWSLANELGLHYKQNYIPFIKELNEISKEIDPYRLTVLAAVELNKNPLELNTITDIIGFNTYPGWYRKIEDTSELLEKLNGDGGNRGLSISEYGAGASIHHHEENPKKVKTKGKWHPEEKQSIVHEGVYSAIEKARFIWGSFLWNMFDFTSAWRNEGDLPGRNDKGLVTYDRKTRKDTYFFYKANWNPEPMVYITSRRFTPRKVALTEVKVYSNCEKVILFHDDKELGEMKEEGMCIFKLKNVKLHKGSNSFKVSGFLDNQVAHEDACDWILE